MAENKDKKVLNVPNIRFPEFKDEWKKCRFKDVCSTYTGNKNTQDKIDNGIYPFYVRSQIIERINSWTFDGEAILTAGDGVGVGKVFHYTKGKIGVHQRVYILSDFKCNARYLFYYFSSKFYNRVKRISAKNSVDSVRKEMITDMPLSLPCSQEQGKIGILMSLLDERIATQNKIIDKLESLIKGISRKLLDEEEGHYVSLENILKERIEKTIINNQYEVLSSTVNGIFIQREYFSREIASSNNVGYKVLRLNDIVLSPQNLWMGNINYNKSFKIGIVSPSYKIFSIADCYDKDFIAALLKTNRALYNYALASEQGASIVRRNLNLNEINSELVLNLGF